MKTTKKNQKDTLKVFDLETTQDDYDNLIKIGILIYDKTFHITINPDYGAMDDGVGSKAYIPMNGSEYMNMQLLLNKTGYNYINEYEFAQNIVIGATRAKYIYWREKTWRWFKSGLSCLLEESITYSNNLW